MSAFFLPIDGDGHPAVPDCYCKSMSSNMYIELDTDWQFLFL